MILTTCVISIWSNDIKCKYMFLFPLKNLARKGLTGLAFERVKSSRSHDIYVCKIVNVEQTMQCSTLTFCGTHPNSYFQDILTSNIHNFNVMVKIFTRPKHIFIHLGWVDGWLGRTLQCLDKYSERSHCLHQMVAYCHLPFGTNFSEIFNQKATINLHEKEYENVCKMAVILSMPECINKHVPHYFVHAIYSC